MKKAGILICICAAVSMALLAAGCDLNQLDTTGNVRKMVKETDKLNASTEDLLQITSEMDAKEAEMATSLILMNTVIGQTDFQISMTRELLPPNQLQESKTNGILATARQVLAENLNMLDRTVNQCNMSQAALDLIGHISGSMTYFAQLNDELEVKMQQILEAMK